MGITVAVINRKGGIGKTTTSLCLAEGLSRKGKSTLLIDLDQQHNSTKQYHVAIEGVATVYDILTERKTDIHECIQHSPDYGDIIAGDDWMNKAEESMAVLDNREYMLMDALAPVKPLYDYVIIDCPPTLGIVVKNVLVASDEVVVPVLCDGYSVESYRALMQQVDTVRGNPRLNPGLKVAGILITQYESGQKLPKSYDEQLPGIAEADGTKVFGTRIRRCCKTKEAQEQGISLFDYAGGCTTAKDYFAFVDEFLDGE
jgi:chromosome partitioning protein